MTMTVKQGNPTVDLGRGGKAVFTGFAVILFAVVAVTGILRDTDQFPGILAGLSIYIASLLIPIYLVRNHAGWFHPLVFTSGFSLLQMVRRASSYFDGMPQHAGIPGYASSDLNALIWQLLLIQTLAQLAYYLGYIVGPKKPQSIFVPGSADPSSRVLLVFALVVVFFVAFLRNKGGLADHMVDLGQGRVRQIEENQMFGISVVVVNLSMFMLLILVAIARTPFHYLLVAIIAPAVMFMKYTAAGSRSSMIFAMILCLMVRSLATRRIRWSLYFGGAVAAIIAIGALGQIRRGTWKGAEGLDEALSSMTASDSFGNGLSELEQRGSALNPVYAIMARVPDEVPYLLGESYITLFTMPIPRALWMNKPRTTGALVGPTFFDSNAGAPPGPIGEALWNFGLPGVVLAYLLFGAFHRYMQMLFLNNSASPVIIAVYALTLLNLQPDVLSIVNWVQIALVGYVVCRLFGIVHRRRVSRPNLTPRLQPTVR